MMDAPDSAPPPAPVPALPPPFDPEALRTLDDAGLAGLVDELSATERATRVAMAPYDRQLGELRARAGQVATERRRRERSAAYTQRKTVRDQAGSTEMPTLLDALTTADSDGAQRASDSDIPLSAVRAFLKTGGQVQFGYPGRPGNLTFTDGRQQRTAATLGQARGLFGDGWELGTSTVPGVRIHMAGTRVERVVKAEDVVIERAGAGGG